MPAAKRHDARVSRSSSAPSRSRPRLILPLVVGPLLCVVALTCLAYLGLNLQAQRDAVAQAGVAAQAAHGALQVNMGALKVTNGQLASALPANVTTLNNNNTEAQQLRSQVGMDTMITQLEQSGFVVVASSLRPTGHSAAAGGLGERLDSNLTTRACASSAAATTGALTIDGAEYIAGAAPLKDGAGACVGAVVTLTPVAAMQQVTLQYTVILAMAGALLALVSIAVGLMLHGRNAQMGDPLRDARLSAVAASLIQTQVTCAAQIEERAWVSRRVNTARRQMERLMVSLAGDRAALQEATADLWAGVSHPGAPVDPATAMRLVREGAVVAARVGSRLTDVDCVSADLFANLDAAHEVDTRLEDALAQSSAALAELQALTGQVASSIPAASAPRRPAAAAQDPFATNVLEAQRRATRLTPSVAPKPNVRHTGIQRAMRPETAQQRAIRPETEQYRTLADSGGARRTPAPGQSQRGRRPGASGMGASNPHRQMGQAGSGGRPTAEHPQAPRPPRPQNGFNIPQDGRDRDASGSRWLND